MRLTIEKLTRTNVSVDIPQKCPNKECGADFTDPDSDNLQEINWNDCAILGKLSQEGCFEPAGGNEAFDTFIVTGYTYACCHEVIVCTDDVERIPCGDAPWPLAILAYQRGFAEDANPYSRKRHGVDPATHEHWRRGYEFGKQLAKVAESDYRLALTRSRLDWRRGRRFDSTKIDDKEEN